ncbi:hypothetical protein PHAVU_008G188600 [Phaseolus vulgaris]|uniref:Uncharacterized protein n=1 Tax=Phaseolus vulgaris TaxID=3885 RepID=V7B6B7_PHAVU|nr:hypothetical protein PHAVU_008G188600g [Phaseolus vulgaris]ESW13349.1 hypothetical protein PHAVU_008G188600g [Phaseolus vulgaris]
MTFAHNEVEKFTGLNDFGLWQLKMRGLLVQQGLLEVLEGESKLDRTMVEKDKTALSRKAHNAIVLKSLWQGVKASFEGEDCSGAIDEVKRLIYD